MKWKLINEPNKSFSTMEQILFNRGIKTREEMEKYINADASVVHDPKLLREERLRTAAVQLIQTISQNKNAMLIIDCDCDGYTSSAILINYLYELFPAWVNNHLKWFLHSSKQHGLSDCIDLAMKDKYSLILIPDAGR